MKGVRDQKMDLLNKKYFLPLLLFLYTTILFLSLTDYDEGAFAATSLQMLRDSNFFIPYLGETIRLEKPILTYWIQMSSISLFGASEFSLRLPSLVASLIWAYCFGSFAKSFVPNSKSKNFIFTLLTFPGVLVMSVVATADAFLNLFICLVMVSLYKFSQHNNERDLLLAALFVGLGFLTKGFAILAVTGPAALLYFLLTQKLNTFFSAIMNMKAWFIFLLIAAPWFTVLYLREGAESIQYLLLGQSFGRFSDTMESHSGSIFYYLMLLPLLVFPYFLNLINGIRRALSEIKPIDIFCLVWFFWVFIFFSFSSTKLPHYLIYGLTPAIYFIEKHFSTNGNKAYRISNFIPHALMFIIYASVPFLFEYVFNLDPSNEASTYYIQQFSSNYAYLIFCGAGIVYLFFLVKAKVKLVKGIRFTALFQAFLLSVFILPAAAKVMQADLKALGLYAKENNIEFSVNRINKPTLSYYSNSDYLRDKEDMEYFISRIDKVEISNFEIIKRQGNYVLLRVNSNVF